MKKLLIAFTLFCVVVCLLPSVGMLFNPTYKPIGNERQTPAPSITQKDGSFNYKYFTELGGEVQDDIISRAEHSI